MKNLKSTRNESEKHPYVESLKMLIEKYGLWKIAIACAIVALAYRIPDVLIALIK